MLTADDEGAIHRIIAQYCYCLDERRFSDLGALFASDGLWEAQYGSATGPEAIARLLAELVPEKPRRKHFVANTLIDPTPGGAEGRSYYMVVREFPQGPGVSVAGTYFDTFQREGGRWVFAHRRLQQDIAGDLGLTR